MKRISILGSTGSIGRSTLAVVDAYHGEIEVIGLAAGTNIRLLEEQIATYHPRIVSVRSETDAAALRSSAIGAGIEFVHGVEGNTAVATHADVDNVVAAIVGAAGIIPVYEALRLGKRVGIANKEVLVAAGDLMTAAAAASGGEILPIDSEHNAVHQALRCGVHQEIARIILTASGGPFLNRDLHTFTEITIEAALAHPTWKMGNKISIDSATMMNKGLEVIEAHHLFQMPVDQIDIAIHPQSIVHSMVEFVDGSIIAQMSTTDMKFPIQYSIFFPERRPAPFARLDLAKIRRLEFLEVEHDRFPAVSLAYQAGRAGGTMPAVLNAANEVAVGRFLGGAIPFLSIVDVVRRVMERHAPDLAIPGSIDEVLHWDRWARNEADRLAVAPSDT
jgi:1-deoxy-D-xylulose-5-phosphate reductoisomerase